MIQEFVDAGYVPKDWLRNNLDSLASFIDRYHSDTKLKEIIKHTMSADHLSIDEELKFLRKNVEMVSHLQDTEEVGNGVEELQKRYSQIQVPDLVPVHDDPNTKNIFLIGNSLQMIDWNKIRLSDPMSDIGAILWWYVQPDKWQDFFTKSGTKLTEDLEERIYLAAAKMSMGFTLWFLTNNKDYRPAFNDFKEALNHRQNSRAWYLK